MSHESSGNIQYKIGIIGAGPAGSMLAYLMASKGHKVTIIERKKVIERRVCGEYLCPKGVELLESYNLLEKLACDFKPLYGMVLVSPLNIVIPGYFPRPTKKEKGLSIDRQKFDSALLEIAKEQGAELLNDKTVTRVEQLANKKWRVNASADFYEFDLLIAADGRLSQIGHQLGHIDHINTTRSAIHCYLPRKIDLGQRLGEMHIFANGEYCGLNPISDEEVNFSIVCNSERLKKEKPETIIKETINKSKRLQEMFDFNSEENTNKIKIISCLKNDNHFVAGNNLAYIGDAAGFIDPLTGEGIYNALLSSCLLAESIEKYSNLDQALNKYKNKKKKLSFQKYVLNNFFQFLIQKPLLVNWTARFLSKSPERANQFIGVIGNINDPITGFIKMLKA